MIDSAPLESTTALSASGLAIGYAGKTVKVELLNRKIRPRSWQHPVNHTASSPTPVPIGQTFSMVAVLHVKHFFI